MARKAGRRIWIAERSLKVGTSKTKRVVVRLGSPEPVSAMDWKCQVQFVSTRGRARTVDVRGVDSFNALLNAFILIRTETVKTKATLTWEGGEQGDPGFPMFVISCLGRHYDMKLEQMVDAAVERFVASLPVMSLRKAKAILKSVPSRRRR